MNYLSTLALIFLFTCTNTFAGFVMEWVDSKGHKTITYMSDSGNMARSDSGQQSAIIDLNAGYVIVLDHARKSRSSINMAQYNQMMSQMGQSMSRIKTGKTKKVNGKTCEVFEVTMEIMGNSMKSQSCEVPYKELGLSKETFRKSYQMAKKLMPQITNMVRVDKGMIAIQTSSKNPMTGEPTVMNLKKWDEQSVDNSRFIVPASYAQMKAPGGGGAMPSAEEMQKGMQQLKEAMKSMTPEQKKQFEQLMKQRSN
ncbi:MAG: hypothetical protein CME65_04215 [Halobacteriovoraceae bacterium]|nr:hypothetical protein [Halobacteriovoraceae bacterium]|tara:strand:+ start:9806 stop:10567 length:762 start_codon:yes stop_codon:yes gene_type:complete